MAKAHEELKSYLVNKPGKVFAVDLSCRVYARATPAATELYLEAPAGVLGDSGREKANTGRRRAQSPRFRAQHTG